VYAFSFLHILFLEYCTLLRKWSKLVVGTVTGLWAGELRKHGLIPIWGMRIFTSPKCKHWVWDPHCLQWVQRALSPNIRWLEHETDHSPSLMCWFWMRGNVHPHVPVSSCCAKDNFLFIYCAVHISVSNHHNFQNNWLMFTKYGIDIISLEASETL